MLLNKIKASEIETLSNPGGKNVSWKMLDEDCIEK